MMGQFFWRQLVTVPPEPGFGAEPQVKTRVFRVTSKMLNALALDHDEAQFLSGDPSGLQPPDIDHQLPADSHHGFFL